MLIENALADAVRFFHIDALSSAAGLKIDFDMATETGSEVRDAFLDAPPARLRASPS